MISSFPSNPSNIEKDLKISSLAVSHLPTWKRELFNLFFSLTDHTSHSTLFSGILIAISFFQVFILMIANGGDNGELNTVIQFLMILPVIQYSGSVYFYLISLYIVSTLTFALTFLLLIARNNGKSACSAYVSQFISPLFWALFVPVTDLFISIWKCSDENLNTIVNDIVCWQGVHIFSAAFSGLAFLLWIAIVVVVVYVSSFSPWGNTDVFAHFPWNFEISYTLIRLHLIIKVWPLFSGLLAYYTELCMNIFIVLYILSCVWHVFPYYNPMISVIFSLSVYSIVLASIFHYMSVIFAGQWNPNNTKDHIFILGAGLVLYPIILHARNRKIKALLKTEHLETAEEIDMQAHYIGAEIISQQNICQIHPMYFYGYLRQQHMTYNNNVDPITSLLSTFISKNGKNISLHLQQARIYLLLFHNAHLANKEIDEAEMYDPYLSQQFEIFYLKIEIQGFLEKKIKKSGKNTEPFSKVLLFEEILSEFLSQLEISTNIYIEFWNELKETRSLDKLHSLGVQIIEKKSEITNLWEKLKGIYSYHLQASVSYSRYLLYVVGSSLESGAVERKTEQIQQNKDLERLFSSDSTAIIVKAIGNSLKILKVSSNATHLLGYKPEQLEDKEIDILMPTFIGKTHKKIMEESFKSMDYLKLGIISTFAIHKDGYLIPIKFEKQQLFSFLHGDLYIGNFMLDVSRLAKSYFLTNDKGRIEGVTKDIVDTFHIKPKVLAEQEVLIQKLFPDIELFNLLKTEGVKTLRMASLGKFLAPKASLAGKKQSDNEEGYNPLVFKKLSRLSTKCDIENFTHPLISAQMKLFSLPTTTQLQEISSMHLLSISAQKISKHIETTANLNASPSERRSPRKSRFRPTFSTHSGMEYKEKEETESLRMSSIRSVVKKDILNDFVRKPSLEVKEKHEGKQAKEIEEKETKSKVGSSQKKIESLRNLSFSDTTHPAVRHLKLALFAFMFLLILIIMGRLIISFVVNSRFSSYPPMMMAIGTRTSSMGHLGQTFWTFLLSRQNQTIPYITTQTQKAFLEYSKYYHFPTDNYTNYTVELIENEINVLTNSELFSIANIKGYAPKDFFFVDPDNINLTYPVSSKLQFNYSVTINSIIYILTANIMETIGKSANGQKVSQDNLIERFILNNLFTTAIQAISNSRQGIIQDFNAISNIEQSFSLALILTLAFIMIFLLVFMVTSLTIVQNELVEDLKLLLEIGKVEVNNQLNETYSYLKTIPLENINENEQIIQKEDEIEQENYISEESNLKGQEKDDHCKTSKRKKRSFIPHTNKTCIIMFVVIILCGIIIGCYVAYDEYKKSQSSTTFYQADQLFELSRTLIFNYYTPGYVYQYIATNKTGYCGSSLCGDYISSSFPKRIGELNDLIMEKATSESYMTNGFYDLFSAIMNENPCDAYFPNTPFCKTIYGGVVTEGIYMANMKFMDLVKSLFYDFSLSNGSASEIQKYINDQRFVDMEILNNLFIIPSIQILTNRILQDTNSLFFTNQEIIGFSFLSLAIFLFSVVYFGAGWLFSHIKKSLYDTKALLSNLPSEIIQANPKIHNFLEETMKSSQ